MTTSCTDRRVLVIGASAGIGRAVAIRAGKAGARLAVAARRSDRLAEVIAEAGGGTAIAADLRDAADCQRIADGATAALGEIDLVVFAAGMAPLRVIEQTSADDWATTMATNVISFNLVTAALLPALAPGAIVAALSSEAVGHARYGLAAYGASKAALEETLRAWRVEHPEVRFSCVFIGPTMPTEFGTTFDRDTLTTAMAVWARQGLTQQDAMATDDVGTVLVEVLATALAFPGIGLEHVTLRSPSPVIGVPPDRR